jgi:hypothetical protein
MDLTDQGIINSLYQKSKEFLEAGGYATNLPNYYQCLLVVVSAAKTVLEDSQPYLDDKLEKM